ncbi:MAG: hypothetical protein H7Y17_06710 [Chlorobia bacterium]|nr:hypothetical protein [Fimbriimonadaceae bacterium]
MRSLTILGFLFVSLSQGFAFDSKTWMHKGCKIHVAVGARETSSIGSLLVTVAAPSGKRATVRVDRDGAMVGAWAADLDSDGKFEVIVATRSAAGGNYGKAVAYSWTGSALKKRSVPELNISQLSGYRGEDQFSVTRNSLYRSYPTFVQKSNDPARKTGNRTLKLNLKRFRWEAV